MNQKNHNVLIVQQLLNIDKKSSGYDLTRLLKLRDNLEMQNCTNKIKQIKTTNFQFQSHRTLSACNHYLKSSVLGGKKDQLSDACTAVY